MVWYSTSAVSVATSEPSDDFSHAFEFNVLRLWSHVLQFIDMRVPMCEEVVIAIRGVCVQLK